MRRAPAILALAVLLLPALPVEATHPEERDLLQEVQDGTPFHVAVNSTGYVRATMRGEKETATVAGHYSEASQFSWTYGFHLTGVLTLTYVDGTLRGSGEARETFHATRFLRLESEGWSEGERRTRSVREEYCEGRHEISWLDDPRLIAATGTLDPERGLVRVTAHSMGMLWHEASDWRPCTIVTDSEHVGTTPHHSERQGEPPVPLAASVLVGDQLTAGRDAWNLDFELPLDEAKQVLVRDLAADLPGGTTPGWTEYLCGRPVDHGYDVGSCEASGTVELRLVVSPCEWRAERYARHAAEFDALAPPPADADLATMLAYGERLRGAKEALLDEARALVIECVEEPEGLDELLRSRMVAHRDALVAFVQAQGPEPRALRELQRAERDLVLVGEAPHPASAELLDGLWPAAPPAGALVAQVHSPVSLHAYAPDGRHVGWNATANASESQVEGATYEGAPGGHQRLTLPGGAWKIVVDETGRGHYRLDVEWEGEDLEGAEAFFARSEPGRTTTTNYVLDVGDDGRALLQTSPARRLATPSEVTFVDTTPLPRADPPRGPVGGAAEPPAAQERSTPAPAYPLVAFLLVAGALARRRRA